MKLLDKNKPEKLNENENKLLPLFSEVYVSISNNFYTTQYRWKLMSTQKPIQ